MEVAGHAGMGKKQYALLVHVQGTDSSWIDRSEGRKLELGDS
jgi:hypothetical protein